jgi:hypothetical protein
VALTLTKIRETADTITLGWTPVPGVRGYLMWREKSPLRDVPSGGMRPVYSQSFDPLKREATFSKDSAWYRVMAIEASAEDGWPDASPPPPSSDWFPASWLTGPADDAIMRQALPPRKGALVGIWDSGPGIPRIELREQQAGRLFDIGAGSYYGGIPDSDGKMTAIKNAGRLPLVDAGHYGAFQAKEILDGARDAYIRQFVRAASAIGGPVLVRHFHEYAGPWMKPAHFYTRDPDVRCTALQWRDMCRRPVDIARAEGISNLIWIWCPTVYDDRASIFASYPGDSYVDIVGDDNYGYADQQWSGDVFGWAEHWEVHNYPRRYPVGDPRREQFKMLHDAFPNKPFAVMETGRAPHSTDTAKKAQWLARMPADAQTYLERMVMLVYSDYGLEADANGREWTLDKPPSALDGWRAAVNDPYFKTR